MILHPAVLALLAGTGLAAGLLVYASAWGLVILRRWDLASGSALQLRLERRTYLVSTAVGLALAFEVAALLLFVRTADALAPHFTGAMCAAGTLAANGWGYPALLARIAVAVAAGAWLVLDHADALGHDYPLIRQKYAFLLGLTPLVVVEAWLQARFFLALDPEVITSCCGSLFSAEGSGLGSVLGGVPGRPAGIGLFGAAAAAVAAGGAVDRWPGRASGFALAGAATFAAVAGTVGLVAFASPYVYELPAHRCPFCLLQAEYRWVGYPLYVSLLGGAILGVGAGVVGAFGTAPSLADRLPPLQRRLAWGSAVCFTAFAVLTAAQILASGLRA